jgi:hypothetical protein
VRFGWSVWMAGKSFAEIAQVQKVSPKKRRNCFFFDGFSRIIGMRRPFSDLTLDMFVREHVSDVILNAAHVSLNLPYSSLKSDNVLLLLRVIQLCLDTGAKLHFISSVAAMGTLRLEEIVPLSTKIMNSKSGYGQVSLSLSFGVALNNCCGENQSKAVCEGIISRLVSSFFFFFF